jgi:glycosyltransferase involved in cell wall biosynthesis
MAREAGAEAAHSATVVFTIAYPYGLGEEFLDGEIPHLLAEFDRVIVVPTLQVRGQSPTRRVADGVIVVAPEAAPRRGVAQQALLALRHPLNAARVVVRSIRGASDFGAMLDDLKFDLVSTQVALRIRRRLVDLLDGVPEVVFYGFWLGVPARVALEVRYLLRRRRSPVVSRANGFDLFVERSDRGYLPMRGFLLGRVDRVFAASIAAEEYLIERYPEHREKYSVERIGTGPAIGPGNGRRLPLRVVSCSYVSQVKRIPMLVDGLAELQRRGVELSWSHIGSGAEDYVAQVVAYAGEHLKHGTFEFLGHLEPDEVRKWYAANPATLFAQMSESEGGLAASIQEALAQGLPVIVTKVGGVAALGDTDLPLFDGLLDAEHTPQEFADRVQLLLAADDATYLSYSSAAMTYWQQNCSVDTLAKGFAARLRALARPGAAL